MGVYIYRVTKERVVCSDGKEANVAVYGYKPTWDPYSKLNNKWHFQSGCTASDRMAQAGRITDRVIFPGNPKVFLNKCGQGSLYDSCIGDGAMFPAIEGVTNNVPYQEK